MKGRFVIAALAVAGLLMGGCASVEQTQTEAALDVRVSETIEVPGADARELFIASSTWFGEQVASRDVVREFTGRGGGILTGTVVLTALRNGSYRMRIRAQMKIRVEDERSTITISDPMYRPEGGMGGTFGDRSYKTMRSREWYEQFCRQRYLGLIDSYRSSIAVSR